MDVIKFDDYGSYSSASVVEGFTSKIWTTRYREFGEFEFRSPLVDETMAALPEESFVGVHGSDEVMQVETHSISTNEAGVEELVVTGRSWLSIFERRFLYGDDYGVSWTLQRPYTAHEAAMVLLYNSVCILGGDDVTVSSSRTKDSFDFVNGASIINKVVLEEPATGDGNDQDHVTTRDWFVQSGEVWKQVLDFLNLGELGIRVVRPPNAVQNKLSIGAVGELFYDTTTFTTDLLIEVYNGRNRTITPSTYDPQPPVVFSTKRLDLDGPKYLLSSKDYRTLCHVSSAYGEIDVEPTIRAGVTRRSMWVDAGNIDDSIDLLGQDVFLRQIGNAALKSANRAVALDGAISINSPYKFGVDYDLGDKVTVLGGHGVSETMQVTEYILSEDKDGEKGYPTLIHVD